MELCLIMEPTKGFPSDVTKWLLTSFLKLTLYFKFVPFLETFYYDCIRLVTCFYGVRCLKFFADDCLEKLLFFVMSITFPLFDWFSGCFFLPALAISYFYIATGVSFVFIDSDTITLDSLLLMWSCVTYCYGVSTTCQSIYPLLSISFWIETAVDYIRLAGFATYGGLLDFFLWEI